MFENRFARPVVVALVAWNGKMEIEHFKESSGRWCQILLLERVSDGFQSWRHRLTKIPNGILRKKIWWGKGREASYGFYLEYVELEVLRWQSRGDLLFCSCASNSSQDWGSCGSSHVVVAETLREAIISVGEDWMLLFMALLRPALNGFRLLMDWKNRSY